MMTTTTMVKLVRGIYLTLIFLSYFIILRPLASLGRRLLTWSREVIYTPFVFSRIRVGISEW